MILYLSIYRYIYDIYIYCSSVCPNKNSLTRLSQQYTLEDENMERWNLMAFWRFSFLQGGPVVSGLHDVHNLRGCTSFLVIYIHTLMKFFGEEKFRGQSDLILRFFCGWISIGKKPRWKAHLNQRTAVCDSRRKITKPSRRNEPILASYKRELFHVQLSLCLSWYKNPPN